MITIVDSYMADVLEPGEIETRRDALDAADRLAIAVGDHGPVIGVESRTDDATMTITVRLARKERTVVYSGPADDARFLANYAEALRGAAADAEMTTSLVRLVTDRTRPRYVWREDLLDE